MGNDPATSVSLLIRARDGEEDAWKRLWDIYGPVIYRQCRRKGFSDADAQEIVQDTFTAIVSGLQDFRRDRPGDSFLRWLRTIATRKMIDRVRRQGANPPAIGGSTAHLRLHELPDIAALEDWNPDEIRQEAYSQALHVMKSNFEEKTWQAFWLTVVDGKPTREVGEILNMSQGAVRNARYKVHNRLVDEIGDLLD